MLGRRGPLAVARVVSVFDATPAQVAALVDAYPLAWVVSTAGDDVASTPLPLLGERDEAGAIASLFGHFGKSNRQVAILERDPRATILFQGPHGYISPALVSNPTWGPTWNYAVVRFDVEIRFVPEETGEAVHRLAAALETGGSDAAWVPERMGERYDQLLRHIIAFRATLRATHARFKLGQDETDVTFNEIVGGLGDVELSRWMRNAAADRRSIGD